jgi:hypothetical protein
MPKHRNTVRMNSKRTVEEDLQWKMFYQHRRLLEQNGNGRCLSTWITLREQNGRLLEQNGIVNFEQNGIIKKVTI